MGAAMSAASPCNPASSPRLPLWAEDRGCSEESLKTRLLPLNWAWSEKRSAQKGSISWAGFVSHAGEAVGEAAAPDNLPSTHLHDAEPRGGGR